MTAGNAAADFISRLSVGSNIFNRKAFVKNFSAESADRSVSTGGVTYVLYHGAGPGNEFFPGHCLRSRRKHLFHGTDGIHPIFPQTGLGRARSDGDLVIGSRRHGRGREPDRHRRRRHRRHRHHQPAGDDHRLGRGNGHPRAPRHRLAGPAHLRFLR